MPGRAVTPMDCNEIVAKHCKLRYTVASAMKKPLLSLFVVVFCGVMGMWNKGTLAAEDPTDRYVEVFALIQQGDAAEKDSDWSAAYSRYNTALERLRAIKSESPGWESQMVDFRIKYCKEQIQGLKGKVPATPPPAVEAPAPPPPAPEVKAAPVEKQNADLQRAQEQIRSLQAQLAAQQKVQPSKSVVAEMDSLRSENQRLNAQLSSSQNQNRTLESQVETGSKQAAENKRLHKDLSDATAAMDNYRKEANRAGDLQKQNDQLKADLDKLRKQPAAQETNFTGKPEDAEVKKLRDDLAAAQTDADRGKKAAAHADELAKENANLRTQLAAAQKPVPYPAESTDVKKLRSDLADARAEIDRVKKTGEQAAELQRQNKDLSDQLSDAQRKVTSQSTDLKRLRSDLVSSRMDAERTRDATSSQVDDLRRQNKDLSAQVATLQRQQAIKPVESTDTSRLQSNLNDTRARTDQLAKENKDLRAQLTEAGKKAATPAESPELKKLRSDLADARAEADRARKTGEHVAQLQKQNDDLSAQLADSQKKAASESFNVKTLRSDLAGARAETERARKVGDQVTSLQKQNDALSAQLAGTQKKAAAQADDLAKENKDLRAQLAETQRKAAAQADGLTKENRNLSAQLAEAQKKAATPVESPELRKLRSDLADARAEADSASKTGERAAQLQKQNEALSAQLAGTQKKAAAQADDLAKENKDLHTQLTEAQRKAAAQVDGLTKENKNLSFQLAEAQKKAATPVESPELNKLRSDLADARVQADRAKKADDQVNDLQRQNKDLSAQLTDARAQAGQAKKFSSRVDELTRQNKELSVQLSAAQRQASEMEKQLAAKQAEAKAGNSGVLFQNSATPAESADIKKLRSDLADAHAETDRTKKNAARAADELTKENKSLSSQLAEAQKKSAQTDELTTQNKTLRAQLEAAQKPVVPAGDSDEVKKLRSDLANARAETERAKKGAANTADELAYENKNLSAQVAEAQKKSAAQADDLAKENKNLSAQLAETQKKAAQADDLTKQNTDLQAKLEAAQKAAPSAGESEEVKKLQSELSDAQQKAAAQADALTKQNKDLSDQLAAAQKPAAPAGESDELKKLQTELSDARTELDHTKSAYEQIAKLQKEDNDLSAQLIEAGKKASTESPEVKKLRSDLADAQAEADRAKKASQPLDDLKKQNRALSDKVASLERQVAAQASVTERSGDTGAAAVTDASDIMHKLRRENSFLRNMLETYSEKDPALKAQLRRYGPAE